MATRSLRNRTASRLSSPAIVVEPQFHDVPEGNGDGDSNEEDDGTWREPPVRTLPPSYKDHKGLERLGVLELQQPLGVPPSQKLLQRLKLNFNRSSNRGTPLQDDEVMSGLDSEAAELDSPMDIDAHAGETDNLAVSSPPRGRPSHREAAGMNSAHLEDMILSPDKANFSPERSDSAAKPTSIQEHLRQERVQTYVNRAVVEAQERGDFALVPGLEKIRRNANDKRELWMVLEAVAHQNPTPEQLHIFKRFIKKGLKRHRRDSARSGSVGSQSLVGDNGIMEQQPQSLPGDNSTTFNSPFRTRQPSASVHPLTKSQQTSPSSHRLTKEGTDGRKSTTRMSTREQRRRSRSNSTSSSLSSAKSIPEELAPPGLTEDEAIGDERRSSANKRQAKSSTRLRLFHGSGTPHPDNPFLDPVPKPGDFLPEKLKKSAKAREQANQELAEIERRRKRLLKESFIDYNYIPRPEIDERHHVANSTVNHLPSRAAGYDDYPAAPVVHPNPVQPKPGLPSLRFGPKSNLDPLMNGNSKKRNYDEYAESVDDSDVLSSLSSSPAPSYDPPPPPPNTFTSRAATPRASTRSSGPPTKVARKSARVMISPNKPKNGGITAGFTRAGPPQRVAELGIGANSSQEDNDEYCASCGGEGRLLCCDGCTNSFHHSCLEPPLDPEEEVTGDWFCPKCLAKRRKRTEESKTFLGKSLYALDQAIPKAFALPLHVREYFEGVRTGEEGEYTEFGQPRTQNAPKMNRAGFIEEPNYKEPRDGKGKLNICTGCGLGTNGKDLVPCDFCDAKWHLDCIDPPLSVPPRRRIGDKPNSSWRCPLHVDQDLAALDRKAAAAPGDLGGEPRRRKPVNAKPLDVDFPRGFRNNGIIEVDLEKDVAAIREIDMEGQIHRLPEHAIRLDFIDRVKKSWYEDKTFPYTANGRRPPRFIERDYRPTNGTTLHKPMHTTITIKEPDFYKGSQALSIVETAKANAEMRRKTLPEQQAVLNLAAMAEKKGGAVYSDALTDLTNALIAEAPEEAEHMLVRDERAQLQRLQKLVQKRLGILDGREGPPVRKDRQSKNKPVRRESAPLGQMYPVANGPGPRPFRELQPAPQGHMFGPVDGPPVLMNGQGQYPMSPYGPYGAPPPHQPGRPAYPFPPTAQPFDWQNPRAGPPGDSFVSWQPSPLQQSPVKSPFGQSGPMPYGQQQYPVANSPSDVPPAPGPNPAFSATVPPPPDAASMQRVNSAQSSTSTSDISNYIRDAVANGTDANVTNLSQPSMAAHSHPLPTANDPQQQPSPPQDPINVTTASTTLPGPKQEEQDTPPILQNLDPALFENGDPAATTQTSTELDVDVDVDMGNAERDGDADDEGDGGAKPAGQQESGVDEVEVADEHEDGDMVTVAPPVKPASPDDEPILYYESGSD